MKLLQIEAPGRAVVDYRCRRGQTRECFWIEMRPLAVVCGDFFCWLSRREPPRPSALLVVQSFGNAAPPFATHSTDNLKDFRVIYNYAINF